MRERELRLGQADKVDRVVRGHRQRQRVGGGQADVLARQYDQATGYETGILAGFEHACQPVQPGVGVRAPDGFYERADHVVVLVFPVVQRPGAASGLDVGHSHGFATACFGQGEGHFQAVQCSARITLDEAGQKFQHSNLDCAPLMYESPAQHHEELLVRERLEAEQGATGQQRPVHTKKRVLCRSADQGQFARLHRWQERVLLGPVEAVNLVQEQHRAPPLLAEQPPGAFDGLADVFYPGRDCGQADEGPLRRPSYQPCERRLARTGRPPQDGRAQPVRFDQRPERSSRPEQALLADHIVQGLRAHAGRERPTIGQAPLHGGLEKVWPLSRQLGPRPPLPDPGRAR